MTIDKAKLKALAEACDSVTTDVHITMAVGSLPEEVKAVQDYLQNSMPDTILDLLAEIDELSKDAERYRWLCSQGEGCPSHPFVVINEFDSTKQDIDAAIDACIK